MNNDTLSQAFLDGDNSIMKNIEAQYFQLRNKHRVSEKDMKNIYQESLIAQVQYVCSGKYWNTLSE